MKTTTRRILSLLLVLILALSLSPTALLSSGGDAGGGTGGTGSTDDTGDTGNTGGDTGTETPPDPPEIHLTSSGLAIQDEGKMTIGTGKGPLITASVTPAANRNDPITWTSSDEAIAKADYNQAGDTHDMYLYGVAPGEATITATIPSGAKAALHVTVSGIVAKGDTITIKENTAVKLYDKDGDPAPGADDFWFQYFGDAAEGAVDVSISSDKPNIVRATGRGKNGLTLDGISAGRATVTLRVTQGGQPIAEKSVAVTVETNEAVTIEARASASDPLKFSTIEQQINAQCQSSITADGDKTLNYITAVSVPTAQGTLYLGYKGEGDTGAGVSSTGSYYAASAARGPYIKDISFVPNPAYEGEVAEITYTGMAKNGRTFKGKIRVTLEEAQTDVSITASNGEPVALSATLFSKVCQSKLGSPLSYVIFTLPPASEGTLYHDYKGETDYGTKVSSTQKYNQSAINKLTFVPAPGYSGTVRIGYAGYSVSGGKYTGDLVIRVTQELDAGIQYNDDGRGYITLFGGDFENYCLNATGARMSYVSFTPPATTQGNLFSYWQGGSQGTLVTSSDRYYYASAPRVDQVTFAAVAGFHGTVRIPFSGVNWNGASFSGTAELHFQSGGAGDVNYTCSPSGFVKLKTADFNSLSMELTGQRLHYVIFNTLPDLTQGTLYHNRTSAGSIGTRVTTATKYFNSAKPYLTNLSFWATENFRGGVEVPFTGCAVSGETFTGVMVINSTAGGSPGSSGANTVTYTTSGRQSVAFDSGDFEEVCQAAAGSSLNYLRFTLPASSQGILYLGYQEGEAPTALGETDSLYRGGEMSVSKVTFVPAQGFSGVASVPFTAWTIGGTQVNGTVAITVRPGTGTLTTVQYATSGAPVRLNAADFQAAAAGNQPVKLRFTALPEASQGKLYYQYVSPIQYSWQANTSTEYSLTGDPLVSNLTFVPKAGYAGVVNIPYSAANADGSTYDGTLRVTVERPAASAYFGDLGGSSPQTIAAVDFLHQIGVVNGMSATQYGPNLSIRRGDFCLMLCRAFRFDAGTGTSLYFSDVPAGAYYADAVNTLSALGIVNGTGNSRFMPSASISRQDAALMIQRTLAAAEMDSGSGTAQQLNAYADGSQVNSYAQGAVAGLLQLGLLPTNGGQIAPRSDLTRSDMAVLLHRTMTQ